MDSEIIYPFGYNDSEKELNILPSLFLRETEFNAKALDPGISIIIGRRGTGKTALANYMRFAREQRYDFYVDIDEPAVFSKIIEQLSTTLQKQSALNIIDDVARMWELSFWTSLMCEVLSSDKIRTDEGLAEIHAYLKMAGVMKDRGSQVIRAIFQGLIAVASERAGTIVDLVFRVHDIFNSIEFRNAREAVIRYLNAGHRAVVVIDTLELYEVRRAEMQQALGAMLQAVTSFALGGVHPNLHIKCFLPAEIVPYLTESSIQNIGKTLENPLYLNWRARDVLKLVCKRLYHFLEEKQPRLTRSIGEINWHDAREVKSKVWERFFPPLLLNKIGSEEQSFDYILRHSQLRPRQVIWLCNSIAQNAHDRRIFPRIDNEAVVHGITDVEERVAGEVMKSYSTVYPQIKGIMGCFKGQDSYFPRASLLEKLASRSKNAWTAEEMPYDRFLFIQMACEIGIVGNLLRVSDGRYEAEFEYVMRDRLVLNFDDECVIHPMFYRYFRIKTKGDRVVYPIGPELVI